MLTMQDGIAARTSPPCTPWARAESARGSSARPLLGGDKNDTDIFWSYSRMNSFRWVYICLYPNPNIWHPIPYPYLNTKILYLWRRYSIVSYPTTWLTLSVFEFKFEQKYKTNMISTISIRIQSVFILLLGSRAGSPLFLFARHGGEQTHPCVSSLRSGCQWSSSRWFPNS